MCFITRISQMRISGWYPSTQQNFGALHAHPSSHHRYDGQVAQDPINSASRICTRNGVTELPNTHPNHSAFDDPAGSLECQTHPLTHPHIAFAYAFFSVVCTSCPVSSATEKPPEPVMQCSVRCGRQVQAQRRQPEPRPASGPGEARELADARQF